MQVKIKSDLQMFYECEVCVVEIQADVEEGGVFYDGMWHFV